MRITVLNAERYNSGNKEEAEQNDVALDRLEPRSCVGQGFVCYPPRRRVQTIVHGRGLALPSVVFVSWWRSETQSAILWSGLHWLQWYYKMATIFSFFWKHFPMEIDFHKNNLRRFKTRGAEPSQNI